MLAQTPSYMDTFIAASSRAASISASRLESLAETPKTTSSLDFGRETKWYPVVEDDAPDPPKYEAVEDTTPDPPKLAQVQSVNTANNKTVNKGKNFFIVNAKISIKKKIGCGNPHPLKTNYPQTNLLRRLSGIAHPFWPQH